MARTFMESLGLIIEDVEVGPYRTFFAEESDLLTDDPGWVESTWLHETRGCNCFSSVPDSVDDQEISFLLKEDGGYLWLQTQGRTILNDSSS